MFFVDSMQNIIFGLYVKKVDSMWLALFLRNT